ncbi:MAG: MaoC family dehydratase [Betaproteobacteria bacterium]|nr:MaoC family dehydratase [Betaproteobacteria bacterium]
MSAGLLQSEPGHVLEGRARQLTLARALALSGGPFDAAVWPEKNLHTDLKAANDAGLAEIVVSGTQWEGYLVGFLAELFGMHWFRHGELDIKIPRSVRIGETLQPKARLETRETQGGALRIALSVWVENQDGAQVLVGTAACTLPPSAAA